MINEQKNETNRETAPESLPGSDNAPVKYSNGYFIREESIPRAGIQVIRHYQRARWINGEVITWIGRKKKVGRGEGSSGLLFDQLTYKDKQAE